MQTLEEIIEAAFKTRPELCARRISWEEADRLKKLSRLEDQRRIDEAYLISKEKGDEMRRIIQKENSASCSPKIRDWRPIDERTEPAPNTPRLRVAY